ncbi:hypothetical protein PMI16_04774 [Herbaspirillum sp. CF444]|uniref:hypothetical protein n=1 Tax=Herbaspirillum sp. CF444 TaxID=1144319 RepID=UPI0002723AB4|nr:hypothetical protein [Herbaspirillum sp. CF444]EJL81168.1 hypothetical protein PMI16_04774 [Herbaspirillum sp. CF444]
MLHASLPLLSAALSLSFSLLVAAPAWAIYKCEADGKVTYSDAACADGKTLNVDTGKSGAGIARTPTQAAGDKTQSQRLEHERARADKQQAKARQKAEREAARAKLVEDKQKRKCTLLAQRKKWADEDLRTATVKNLEKARRKSLRVNEQYQAECPA